jgi:hypothetical protein
LASFKERPPALSAISFTPRQVEPPSSGEVKVEYFKGRVDLPDNILEALVEGMNKYNAHNIAPSAFITLKESQGPSGSGVLGLVHGSPKRYQVGSLLRDHVLERTGTLLGGTFFANKLQSIRRILREYSMGIDAKGKTTGPDAAQGNIVKDEKGAVIESLNASNAARGSTGLVEELWPRDVVAALEEAARLYPPRGCVKVKVPGVEKKLGRNEQIAHHILLKTGKYRSRAQVTAAVHHMEKKNANRMQEERPDPTPTASSRRMGTTPIGNKAKRSIGVARTVRVVRIVKKENKM